MTENDTPLKLLSIYEKRYPGFFRYMDDRLQNGDPVRLSDAAQYYVAAHLGNSVSLVPFTAMPMAACYQWRSHKRMYIFDDTLAQMLIRQSSDVVEADVLPVDGDIPLPSPAFYIKAPNVIAAGIDGCYVWQEPYSTATTLQFVFLSDDMTSAVSGRIVLLPQQPLLRCLPDADEWIFPLIVAAANGNDFALKLVTEHSSRTGPAKYSIHNMLLNALQLVLYISCSNAELSPFVAPAPSEPASPPFVFSGDAILVGGKTGAKLRQETTGGTNTLRKAHTRKGHWHSYWIGPRNGERHKILKWISPVFVSSNVSDVEVIAVTQ